jgi:Flp pilus assembly protein TadD/peroxiredoxin
MARHKDKTHIPSRRAFLKSLRWSPMLFLPAPLRISPLGAFFPASQAASAVQFPLSDYRFTPHYPVQPPLEAFFRQILPGLDEYVLEKHAFDLTQLLDEWGVALRAAPPALAVLAKFVAGSIETTPLVAIKEVKIRNANGIEVIRSAFADNFFLGRERFLREIRSCLHAFTRIQTAEFEIVAIKPSEGLSNVYQIDIRYELAGTRTDNGREQRIGHWRTQWSRSETSPWQVLKWQTLDETISRAHEPIFIDVTSDALGQTESYKKQLLHGVDYWRTILDGACGIDVYGNNGLAVGDFDSDGFDDFYVCQPAGLPNRLYRNRGDGTFEDATEKSGVNVLDATASAIFADFENKGVQDLLVVCGSGPLLFLNQGNGTFSLNRDAFKFVHPPQGTFTHASVADYDRDGRLDIYLCLYSYYLGLDQYHYPAPYFDARNGPPNFLLHNEGNATFQDRTEAVGLNVDNDRYSFASAWGDANGDGWPDLYVVNDFGRNNLYRNNGDGTFSTISTEAGVEDVGAGMSAAWCDFDNQGQQDLYAANMWATAGIRVSEDPNFHPKDSEDIRALYRQHARGNSLYRNQGSGKFKNVSTAAGVDMGRWAWCSDAWDFDHDGFSDLYIANGYISGPDTRDLSSFFWRHVVANSPSTPTPTPNYEQGWQAINELIRSDVSWCGYERNVSYLNNQDGTFSNISAITGLDFVDDSRSFALADLDRDGRLEVILKNRNTPQLRILHNALKDLGASISFRLRGRRSNRDAIGAAVTVETESHNQTKYLQAGSGFLSQHTKELFFGLGSAKGTFRATVRWPNGLTQSFEKLPLNNRIELDEGSETFQSKPYSTSLTAYEHSGDMPKQESLPPTSETWFIEPLAAPDFSLPDLDGNRQELHSFRAKPALLHFWSTASPQCPEQFQLFKRARTGLTASGLQIIGINLDNPANTQTIKSFAAQQGIFFPTLLATPDVAGIYNVICRHLFDRRRDLAIPTSLLLDGDGKIVKIYQGQVSPEHAIEDSKSMPKTPAARIRRALPFEGTLYLGTMQRNDFTFGVALFQHGYLEQAAASFEQVIAAKPGDPDAYYNLGTLYLRQNDLKKAEEFLEQTVKLRTEYPEAWNNLGMIAAQRGSADEAVRHFQHSLQLRPDYTVALLNLGNLYRRQGNSAEAEKLLNHALELEPNNPEVNYALGMLFARQEQLDRASQYLQRAIDLRPNYADALNNLGVLLVRAKRYSEAQGKFTTCIRLEPNFDQAYLNLARLYAIQDEKEKAKEVLQELLRIQPQHKIAQQTLEMLH